MSTANLKDFKEANAAYVKGFRDGKVALPPARKVAVVTCMDARIHIEKALGLNIGDAHVIRNAGGSISPDALRSLVISEQLLGTQEILVIKHTDCGMLTFDNPTMVGVLEKQLGKKAAKEGETIDWLTFKNLEESVKGDVQLLKDSKLIPDTIHISGHIYDVTDGSIKPVI